MPRRSTNVVVGGVLTSVAAAVLSACGRADAEPMRCVDRTSNAVVDDTQCSDDRRRAGGVGYPFLWYYGGMRSGSRVSGGSFDATSGTTYRSATGATRVGTATGTSVSRGGFGSTGRGTTSGS